MANPKKQTRKPSSEAQEQTAKVPEEIPEVAKAAPAGERVARPLEEFLAEAKRAYEAYLEAVRRMVTVYGDNELLGAKTCKRTEQEAQDSCEQAIAQGMKVRDEAVAQALKDRDEIVEEEKRRFRRAKKQAEGMVREVKEESERVCGDVIAEALKARSEEWRKLWPGSKCVATKPGGLYESRKASKSD